MIHNIGNNTNIYHEQIKATSHPLILGDKSEIQLRSQKVMIQIILMRRLMQHHSHY